MFRLLRKFRNLIGRITILISLFFLITTLPSPLSPIAPPTIIGVVQILYNYNFLSGENSWSTYRTSFGLDGEITKWSGYRVLINLNPQTYNFESLDFYGRIVTPVGELRIGQFKVPFSMERLTSFHKRDFVENAIATGLVNGRDIGVAIFGKKDWIEYNFGIFNGEGMNLNDSDRYKDIVGRILFIKSFKLKARIAVGGAFYLGKSRKDNNAINNERYNFQLNTELKNFFLRSEYVGAKDGDMKGHTFYATIGYKLVINRFQIEPVARLEFQKPSGSLINETITKITGGINIYLKGYSLRFQVNLSTVIVEDEENYSKLTILSQFAF